MNNISTISLSVLGNQFWAINVRMSIDWWRVLLIIEYVEAIKHS